MLPTARQFTAHRGIVIPILFTVCLYLLVKSTTAVPIPVSNLQIDLTQASETALPVGHSHPHEHFLDNDALFDDFIFVDDDDIYENVDEYDGLDTHNHFESSGEDRDQELVDLAFLMREKKGTTSLEFLAGDEGDEEYEDFDDGDDMDLGEFEDFEDNDDDSEESDT